MNPGRHAADDGGFGRSAGGAALRGTLLIAVAVLLGVVLLNANDDPAPFNQAATDRPAAGDSPTTTVADTAPTTVALRPPAEVKVLVANGSGVSGVAGTLSEQLGAQGYNVLSPTNTAERVEAAAVYFAPGFDAEAAALAADLGLPASSVQALAEPPPVDDARGAQLLVVIDPALAERIQSPPAEPAADPAAEPAT